MKAINTYLNFPGTSEEAFSFYKTVFGGEYYIMRFKETPEAEKLSPELAEKAMHISLPIGKDNTLMATDALEEMGHKTTPGNNYFICLDAESEAEAQRLFDGLSAGGKVEVPLGKMFWGALYGQITDKFGIQWMINFNENPNA